VTTSLDLGIARASWRASILESQEKKLPPMRCRSMRRHVKVRAHAFELVMG